MLRGAMYAAAGTALAAVLGVAFYAWSHDEDDPLPSTDIACHAGAYRDATGRLVTLTPSDGGLRYRLESGRLTRQPDGRWAGTLGWTDEGPSIAEARIGKCGAATFEFGLPGEPMVGVTRQEFRIRETRFESRGVKLAGRLVMPPGPARAATGRVAGRRRGVSGHRPRHSRIRGTRR